MPIIAMEEEKNQGQVDSGASSSLFSFEHSAPGGSNYKQTLVADLLAVLTEKLQSFWKLAQSYSNTEDERYREKQDDIDVSCCLSFKLALSLPKLFQQMVLNTTNVNSWMLLNALSPSSLPESIQSQYKDQFVVWNSSPPDVHIGDLFFALKTLRFVGNYGKC